jgi:hypothetical protein
MNMGDIMLLGILRMPFDDHGDLHIIQLKGACIEAANRIESDAKTLYENEKLIDRLETKIEDLNEQLYNMQETYENKIECLTENYETQIEEMQLQMDEG